MKPQAVLIPALLGSLFAVSSPAEARPDLRKLSCSQAQNMVRQNGAVVFTTGRHTYSRFVINKFYCDRWQYAHPKYSATRDNPQCQVAFECREPLFSPFPG